MAKAPKQTRRGLGRGLSTLIGDLGSAPGEASVPIERVRSNDKQPRREFSDAAMDDLVASIKANGVIQPLIVRPIGDGNFEIVAGERRWRAAQQARLHEVPVVIRQLDDDTALEISIIENIQREDLNAIEEADAYHRLMETFGHTHQQLSTSLGKSRSHITNMLRLRTLSEDVQEHVRQGRLSMGHARALLSSVDASALAKKVVDDGLSVRRTEQLAASQQGTRTPRGRPHKDADTREIETQLAASLDAKVSILVEKDGNGQLQIGFRSLDQLDGIIHRLTAELATETEN